MTEAERKIIEAAEALTDALYEVEDTHATREPSEGEVKHLMRIVNRATRAVEHAVAALRQERALAATTQGEG